ncbi:hypothetical protein K443DRAFT_126226 [Laccaria amethystina LaAM-08-1]|uniref:Uncharacterized protein n=1 Tax=Laccaria amethystina LaAM-08-1 TaxID=1095629 RepID=A0A0C9WHM9_9AGAR|nr:hypothetical protein K443DRAFT_657424 [Laccaria amethystina LaAM-08-1]KIJ91474.1 hypothetical protein K443DRAFT_126226 [Laccaria amethystina LaAM-08-1]
MLVYPPLAEATTPMGKGFWQRIPVVAEMRSRGEWGIHAARFCLRDFGCGSAHGQENEDGVFLSDQVASGPCTPCARRYRESGDGSKSTSTRLIAHAFHAKTGGMKGVVGVAVPLVVVMTNRGPNGAGLGEGWGVCWMYVMFPRQGVLFTWAWMTMVDNADDTSTAPINGLKNDEVVAGAMAQ